MDHNSLTTKENRNLMKLKKILTDFLGDHNVRFILYGSKARMDYHYESDIDLAI
ncbi:MAG: nucleotidyltransferase domain-containing protein, partial [Candidatus Aminicenantales bacterium]